MAACYNIIGMRKFIGLFFLFFAALASWAAPIHSDRDYLYADIGHETYLLELANTMQLRFTGLSGRFGLDKNQGMVFVLDWLSRHEFTMRGMKFPLDFIWLDGNLVVDLTEKVPFPRFSENPRTIMPSREVDTVIELYAGEIKNSGIKVGDLVDFYELE